MTDVDVVVVGSGPNGLAAAVTLAGAGLSVTVVEGADTTGGGCRTEPLTLPGFRHDVCSTAHPMVLTSPFFRQPAFSGLRAMLRQPEVPFAHPLDGGEAAAAFPSVVDTAQSLGADRGAYLRLLGPLVDQARLLGDTILSPLRSVPLHPVALARFGLPGLLPSSRLVGRFETEPAKALLAGVSAHSMARLTAPLTGAFGLFLAMTAHAAGWPVVETGELGDHRRHGGRGGTARRHCRDRTVGPLAGRAPRRRGRWCSTRRPRDWPQWPGMRCRRVTDAPSDGSATDRVSARWTGPCPVPCPGPPRSAGGPGRCTSEAAFTEVASSEADVAAGRHPERPYCIVVQAGVADTTRAPDGQEALWGYCHVPSGSTVDMSSAIEAQIDRFAPGFSDLVLARSVRTAVEEEAHNPNYVGGDIASGASTLRQTLFRPTIAWNPYRTPLRGVYLCSASTAPGAGVHGMCGVYAARTVLHDHFGGPAPFRSRPAV